MKAINETDPHDSWTQQCEPYPGELDGQLDNYLMFNDGTNQQ